MQNKNNTQFFKVKTEQEIKVKDVLREFKERAKKEIDKLTSMNVVSLEVVAKNVYVPEKEDEEN